MTAKGLAPCEVVDRAELLGLTPSEWCDLAATVVPGPHDGAGRAIEPLSPQEWREAVLSQFEEGNDDVLEP